MRDKNFVSAFLRHAEEIFATARTAGTEDCDLSILVNREGGIHMIAGADWQLESLRAHHGASAAYRVHRSHGSVRLEARSATQSCTLAAERPERALLPPLPEFPRYLILQ
ncbi:MAG: hypothetical protein WBY44_30995 [Bryobacteraceae bacterium]